METYERNDDGIEIVLKRWEMYLILFAVGTVASVIFITGCLLGSRVQYEQDKQKLEMIANSFDVEAKNLSEKLGEAIENLNKGVESLKEAKKVLDEPSSTVETLMDPTCEVIEKEVTITSYTNSVSETDSTPNLTSTQNPVRRGIVAASRDLIEGDAPYGTKICIKEHTWENHQEAHTDEGCHVINRCYTVDDTMHPRKKKQIDVFTFSKDKALEIGRGTAVIDIYRCKQS